jgi:hypothetical protein
MSMRQKFPDGYALASDLAEEFDVSVGTISQLLALHVFIPVRFQSKGVSTRRRIYAREGVREIVEAFRAKEAAAMRKREKATVKLERKSALLKGGEQVFSFPSSDEFSRVAKEFKQQQQKFWG